MTHNKGLIRHEIILVCLIITEEFTNMDKKQNFGNKRPKVILTISLKHWIIIMRSDLVKGLCRIAIQRVWVQRRSKSPILNSEKCLWCLKRNKITSRLFQKTKEITFRRYERKTRNSLIKDQVLLKLLLRCTPIIKIKKNLAYRYKIETFRPKIKM